MIDPPSAEQDETFFARREECREESKNEAE